MSEIASSVFTLVKSNYLYNLGDLQGNSEYLIRTVFSFRIHGLRNYELDLLILINLIYWEILKYTAVPVCEMFATWDSLVSEGRFVRVTKDHSETESHLPGYEPITKIQILRYEIIISIRLKSAKFNKKHITMHL